MSSTKLTTNKKALIAVIITITPLIFIICLNVFHENALMKQGAITSGVIYKVGPRSRGGAWYEYSFDVSGKKYYGEISNQKISLKKIKALKESQRPIPVLFDSLSPDNSYMLIIKEDYERFYLPFPDSMNWVYFEK